ncbi:MAG: sigma-70 family RNA polymerase sigma factor [Thermomicrobiales bacterium]|nr:sigma-70 family RNA polymerase sigma factor [Thermomicrobiales bacterium]
MHKQRGAVALALEPDSTTIPWRKPREHMVTPAERELQQIAAAQADPARFAPLYDAYMEQVWRFAMSRLGDPERARDVTSQTFVKAIQSLKSFTPKLQGEGTSFPSWLMMIARNTIIDEQRKQRPTADIQAPELQAHLAATDSPEQHAISRDTQERVRQAIAQLNPRHQRIVQMRIAGYSGAEIAEAMDMTLNGVRTAHSRAYARLRDLLADEIETKEHSK